MTTVSSKFDGSQTQGQGQAQVQSGMLEVKIEDDFKDYSSATKGRGLGQGQI